MAEESGLQFDRAEFEAQQPNQLSCGVCQQRIAGSYYTAGEKIVCMICRDQWQRTMVEGSGLSRFLRSVAFGVPAAAAGALLYYAISALTGYEFGLVAIVIGLMVGGAVRYGSRGIGGWQYQLLAIGLTYVAIVSTYIPHVIEGVRQNQVAQQGETAAEPAAVGEAAATDDNATSPVAMEQAGVGTMLMALGFLVLIAMAMPFFAGLQNLMGLLIIGFGLYQAWKMNKRVDVQLAGPYELGSGTLPQGG